MDESEIIRGFFPRNSFPEDDCFFLAPDLLISTDSLAEGTHFLHEWSSPKDLAEKLIEVNLSDIAASGGRPELCFLNLGLSALSQKKPWVLEFQKAFRKRLEKHKITLAGGDTFFSRSTHLTLTILGKTAKPWSRSGGKDGDYLYLTGEIGNSELGLHCLKTKEKQNRFQKAIQKHLSPTSRASLVPTLQTFNIHACMDVTDGLIQDSLRLAKASHGVLEIFLEALPVSKLALETLGWDAVLGSGEELELLFLSNENLPEKIAGQNVTKIGRFVRDKNTLGKGKVQFQLGGEVYHPKQIGFSHFPS
ncbi:thiamine-phosphate kinase [Leptospira ryugenii]|uniref:Thiamine-monophosphate kinase n=1 Tax=Leptospira ryugenii TaxID=1917863 RepID=A0A2P2DY45_9LEPT|nr:thiamine-phosphate kinase [Leptospira ryugenii]GBF49533.1 thiamine-phosphate kinase [Leptospira ryugenii]